MQPRDGGDGFAGAADEAEGVAAEEDVFGFEVDLAACEEQWRAGFDVGLRQVDGVALLRGEDVLVDEVAELGWELEERRCRGYGILRHVVAGWERLVLVAASLGKGQSLCELHGCEGVAVTTAVGEAVATMVLLGW